ncbi:MAG: molybdate ABC transporter permease subunit [Saprospiraceae bacterium]|nr:molybdate ABC transporter permease subunit [Saprospiraceae bacterium]
MNFIEETFWETLLLTVQLAGVTTGCLLVIGLPLGWLLAISKSRLKPFFEALVSMPLVLPPTVLGFYLLLTLSPDRPIGQWLDHAFNIQLVFTFSGLVVGSIIYSLPFMVQPIQAGFESLPKHLAEASYTLGKSRWITFTKVLLPNIRSSILSGLVLSFAHTVGEFGVVLMIGGNIPGQTRVASIAIYDEVEGLNYGSAHEYAIVLVIFSFIILLLVYTLNAQKTKVL